MMTDQGGRKRGAVFFDRDGTLNVDHGYVFRPADLVFIDGAVEAVRLTNERGLLAIVVTNQSGVGRGFFTLEEMHAFHAAMDAAFEREGARIDAWYACPFIDGAAVPAFAHPDHPDRKPNPGMTLKALADFALDPDQCLTIGDRMRDIEASRAAGVRGVLFEGGRLDHALRLALERPDAR
jgi:D-glycero-D-manno-heptose 1,7-bisphosphate phosphatase